MSRFEKDSEAGRFSKENSESAATESISRAAYQSDSSSFLDDILNSAMGLPKVTIEGQDNSKSPLPFPGGTGQRDTTLPTEKSPPADNRLPPFEIPSPQQNAPAIDHRIPAADRAYEMPFETNGVERGDGAREVYIPEHPASAQNPAFTFSGNGNDIGLAFTYFERGYNHGPSAIEEIRNGNDPVPVVHAGDHDNVNIAGWCSKNGLRAYSSDAAGSDKIFVLRPGESSPSQLTGSYPPGKHFEPSVSPDGKWVVFEATTGTDDRSTRSTIWKIASDGSQLTQLSNDTDDRQPIFSPDGSQIVFQRREGESDRWNLCVMDLVTDESRGERAGRIKQITDSGTDTDASWSSDGEHIIYSRSPREDAPAQIYAVSRNGGTPSRITHSQNEDGAPVCSPDGKWIVFESHSSEKSASELMVIAAPKFD